MDGIGLNKLCIEVDGDEINFDEVMRKAADVIGCDVAKMENELYKAWINDDDFEFEFIYSTDYGDFECRIVYTGTCIFVESDTKYACIEVTEIIEEIIRSFITC